VGRIKIYNSPLAGESKHESVLVGGLWKCGIAG
jgi:hypothetical protein